MIQENHNITIFRKPTFSQVVPIQMSEKSNPLVQSSGDKVAAEKSVGIIRENNLKRPVRGGEELGNRIWRTHVNSQDCRQRQRVKRTDTLWPKGNADGNIRVGAPLSRTTHLSVDGELLSSVSSLQRGTWQACKSPGNRKANRKVLSMGLQVREVVESKSPSVMEGIQSPLWRESEPTYHWSLFARTSEKPLREKSK